MQAIGLFNVYMSNPHLKEDLFPKSKKKTDITIPRRTRATFHCHLNKQVSPIPVILKARKEMWLAILHIIPCKITVEDLKSLRTPMFIQIGKYNYIDKSNMKERNYVGQN